MPDLPEPEARVLEIQRMSTEDGPGIRTTVFFKGCSLACAWCHNPESISARPQVIWHDWKCLGCRQCVSACPEGARSLDESGGHSDPDLCVRCFSCVEACPSTALERLGTPWRLPDLVAEVAKDRAYFDSSGGGVTAGGGEPTLQAPFVAPFLGQLRELGIHTALDTCCQCARAPLLEAAARADLLLVDIKLMDSERHKELTGHSNERILENAAALRDLIRGADHPMEMWVRTPLIPGATAGDDNVRAVGSFVALALRDVVTRWELPAFNNLCKDKYRRLGLEWDFADTPLLGADELERFAEVARASGVDPDIVHATGATRVEPGQGDSAPARRPPRGPC